MKNFIDETIEQVIGFEYLTCQMAISSSYGIKHLNNINPYTMENSAALLHEYDLIGLFIEKKEFFPKVEAILRSFKDIYGIIQNCINNKILDLIDLYEIKLQAISMNQLREQFNEQFNIEELALYDCMNVIKLLSNDLSHITTDFYLYSSYSKKLEQIRAEKRRIEQLYYNCIDDKEKEKYLTIRSDVIILEEEEEQVVRKELSKKLKQEMPHMAENIYKIGYIDALITKAKLALKYNGIKPQISQDEISFDEMVNPFIKDKVEKAGNSYTRNSIVIKQGTTVLTGANMSGKSAVLKTVLLNVLLAHLGFFVFAKEAHIPLFDCVKYVGVENEKPLHGLSSFGHEINMINDIINSMKERKCLVLIDEFARSTNPYEGQKFVKALALFANTLPSFTILTTHYDGVVTEEMCHYEIVGLKKDAIGAYVNISNINNYMDYTLRKVTLVKEVPKEAYNVSLILGIDKDYLRYLNKCYEEGLNE